MTLSKILKAALLSRLVGVDPIEACALAERSALTSTNPPTPERPGSVVRTVGDFLSENSRFRTSSPYTRGGTVVDKVESSVSKN